MKVASEGHWTDGSPRCSRSRLFVLDACTALACVFFAPMGLSRSVMNGVNDMKVKDMTSFTRRSHNIPMKRA